MRKDSVRTFLAVSVFLFFGKIEIGENTDKKNWKSTDQIEEKYRPKNENTDTARKVRTIRIFLIFGP